MVNKAFYDLLEEVQNYISETYSQAITDYTKQGQVKPYIANFLRSKGKSVPGMTFDELSDALFKEMVEYSFLTDYMTREDIEEINVNSWDDVAITYVDGHIEKVRHFNSPQHAVDIIKRLLQHSNMVIDNALPIAQGHLPNNTRITAIMSPVVDPMCGISASIRLLHPAKVNMDQLVEGESATEEMLAFLCMCLRYGVSFIVAGATSSGKTTLLNALLSTIPNNKRIYVIESGAREISLVKWDDEGNVINNVVHTLSRPSDIEKQDITQEDLVITSLRFNPDIVVVGEMRDEEAHSAVECALTGHTVVSSVHAFEAEVAYDRLALLSQKKSKIDYNLTLAQVTSAFPLVIYEHKLEDYSRKIMSICECRADRSTGEIHTQPLYQYIIDDNIYDSKDGTIHIKGHFEKSGNMSERLKRKLLYGGVPRDMLMKFFSNEEEKK